MTLLMCGIASLSLEFCGLGGGAENAGRGNDGREIDGPICRA